MPSEDSTSDDKVTQFTTLISTMSHTEDCDTTQTTGRLYHNIKFFNTA